jgi:acetyl-CoA carboxylase carboxyl transferase subunit alpha
MKGGQEGKYAAAKAVLDELQGKIRELRALEARSDFEGQAELEELCRLHDELRAEIFAQVTPWDTVLLARHERRPYTLDYAAAMFDDYIELHGDRRYGDDQAIVAGLARLEGRSVAFVGHQKGRSARERQQRNFAMARADGYRKAMRVMDLAARYGHPILTFVDTPGADCLEDGEARGISEAIADAQRRMFALTTPIVVTIIGEGGSGGAIAIGVGDHIIMLQYAYYSVIAPEACAAIIWHDGTRRAEAAAALRLGAADALELGVVDEIVEEPLGGAHADPPDAAERLKAALTAALDRLSTVPPQQLLDARYSKFRNIGRAWVQGLG